ncbi:MAG: hypothetical protein ACPG7F_06170 [Aggregatilineales bacterium]
MMAVAKGRTLPDGTYIYTCGNCGGVGWHASGDTCNHCYALDYAQITEAIKSARGQRYYALLKAALSISGKAIVHCANAIKNENKWGKLRFVDLGYIALRFNLNLKSTIEWLEETRSVPFGTSNRRKRVVDSNGKRATVAMIFDAARETYGEIELWQPEEKRA